jgi:hypothetical protein
MLVMSSIVSYIEKQGISAKIAAVVPTDLTIVVVVPSFNEPDLRLSVAALFACDRPPCSVEILVVVNSGVNCPTEALAQNRLNIRELMELSTVAPKGVALHCLEVCDIPHKVAGVGFARKWGMDEALLRLYLSGNEGGIIAGFDADSLCNPNYLTELFRLSQQHVYEAASLHFEHRTDAELFDAWLVESIAQYELHLRYFVAAQRWCGLPYAFHTIGSSFALTATAYAKYDGMNQRKAGEDFYFLQKIIPFGKFGNLNTTCVRPSPRSSDRVPFGTGACIRKMEDAADSTFYTYQWEAFGGIKVFVKLMPKLYAEPYEPASLSELPAPLLAYLQANDFEIFLRNTKKQSPNFEIFSARFFLWWNAFRVMRYLNDAHHGDFARGPIRSEIQKLERELGMDIFAGADSGTHLEAWRKHDREEAVCLV